MPSFYKLLVVGCAPGRNGLQVGCGGYCSRHRQGMLRKAVLGGLQKKSWSCLLRASEGFLLMSFLTSEISVRWWGRTNISPFHTFFFFAFHSNTLTGRPRIILWYSLYIQNRRVILCSSYSKFCGYSAKKVLPSIFLWVSLSTNGSFLFVLIAALLSLPHHFCLGLFFCTSYQCLQRLVQKLKIKDVQKLQNTPPG